MTENDIIAEYVKEKYPFLIDTFGFQCYKLKKNIENIGEVLVKIFKENKEQIMERARREANEEANNRITGLNIDTVIVDEFCGCSSKDEDKVHDTDGETGRAESEVQHESDTDQDREENIDSRVQG